jgi:hypothetical protein
MTYFVIYASEDGETYVTEYTAEQLEAKFNGPDPDYRIEQFVGKIPDKDTNYWDVKMILIRGEIVMPKAKEVVTKVTLEDV